jgi:hypothetical protein
MKRLIKKTAMKEIKSLDEIQIGKMYKISWDGGDNYVFVKSINKPTEEMYKNSIYLNDKERVDLFEMEVYELDDEDKVNYCKEHCEGVGYCGGRLEDGTPCEFAPSKEVVKREFLKY